MHITPCQFLDPQYSLMKHAKYQNIWEIKIKFNSRNSIVVETAAAKKIFKFFITFIIYLMFFRHPSISYPAIPNPTTLRITLCYSIVCCKVFLMAFYPFRASFYHITQPVHPSKTQPFKNIHDLPINHIENIYIWWFLCID